MKLRNHFGKTEIRLFARRRFTRLLICSARLVHGGDATSAHLSLPIADVCKFTEPLIAASFFRALPSQKNRRRCSEACAATYAPVYQNHILPHQRERSPRIRVCNPAARSIYIQISTVNGDRAAVLRTRSGLRQIFR